MYVCIVTSKNWWNELQFLVLSSVFFSLSAIQVWSWCGPDNPSGNGPLTHTTVC